MGSSDIDADVVAEGVRVLSAAREQDVPLRLLGGVAVRLRARNGLPAALQRTYGDLDFVTERRASGPAQKLFRELGYEPHVSFNALNSKERLLFFDHEHDRQVDVFVGAFRMCHEVPLEGRIEQPGGEGPSGEGSRRREACRRAAVLGGVLPHLPGRDRAGRGPA